MVKMQKETPVIFFLYQFCFSYRVLSQRGPCPWTLVVWGGTWWETPGELKLGLRSLECKAGQFNSWREYNPNIWLLGSPLTSPPFSFIITCFCGILSWQNAPVDTRMMFAELLAIADGPLESKGAERLSSRADYFCTDSHSGENASREKVGKWFSRLITPQKVVFWVTAGTWLEKLPLMLLLSTPTRV